MSEGVASPLDVIEGHLANMAAALLKMSGIAGVDVDAQGMIHLRTLSEEEKAAQQQSQTLAPQPRILPSDTKARNLGDGLVLWEFVPPPPWKDRVSIVCRPDDTQPCGIACQAIRKDLGGERTKFNLVWEKTE